MEANNNQTPQDEAFELELTDDQLEAVAGGADPREFAKRIAAVEYNADLTTTIRPSGTRPSQSTILNADK